MNENIKDFSILNFIDSQISPHFAILLKGKWGCGKTYLINQILDDVYEKDKKEIKKHVIYISLYGISTLPQLRSSFFTALHPFTNNKFFHFFKKAFDEFVKFKYNFDISFIDFSELLNSDKVEKEFKILIVDDIERSSLPINDIFGFFSNIIINTDIRTFFVGDTTKIDSQKSNFSEIQEKLIGLEFEVEPDVEALVNSEILDSHKLYVFKQFILECSFTIFESFGYKNLRALKQALYLLEQIFSNVPELLDNESYSKTVIEYFVVLFLQKAAGKLTEIDVLNAIDSYYKSHQTLSTYDEMHKDDNYIHAFPPNIAFMDLYSDVIFKGIIDREKILIDFENRTKPIDKRTTLQKLYQWIDLSDDEFNQNYKILKDRFNNNQILSLMELFSFFEMELNFIKMKLLNKSPEELKISYEDYLKTNKSILTSDFSYMGVRGYEFKDSYLELDKEVESMFGKLNNELEKNSIQPVLTDIYKKLPASMNFFLDHVKLTGNISIYNGYPILSMIDINDFFEKVSTLTFEEQRTIFHAFNERYEKAYSNGQLKREYFADIDSVKSLSELYKNSIDETFMKPSNIKKQFLSEAYKELYEWMVQQKEMKENQA